MVITALVRSKLPRLGRCGLLSELELLHIVCGPVWLRLAIGVDPLTLNSILYAYKKLNLKVKKIHSFQDEQVSLYEQVVSRETSFVYEAISPKLFLRVYT